MAGTEFVLSELEGLVETDHVLARTERVEGLGFLAEHFLAVVRGFDRETDAALGLIDLDNPGFDILAGFEDIFDFLPCRAGKKVL